MKYVVILAALLSTFIAPAQASDVTGKVQQIVARSPDGLTYVVISAALPDRPPCAAHQDYFMIADEHSDIGKSQIAILLSAYMADKPVRIIGSGTCTRWGDGEDISQVILG